MSHRATVPIKALKRGPLLHRDVQEAIRSYIIANALKPGDALPPETALARQLGVSRNSVREAVRSLAALGIVEVRPGSGLFVREFSFDSVVDNLAYDAVFNLEEFIHLLDVRRYIELGMVERVIAAAEPSQMATLRRILVDWRQAAERGAYSAAEDRSFHRTLYGNLDNPLLARIVDAFWVVYSLALERVPVAGERDPIETYRRHERIAAALLRGDAAAMREAIMEHYAAAERRAVSAQQLLQQGATLAGLPPKADSSCT